MALTLRTSKNPRAVSGLDIEPGRVAAAQVSVNGAVHLTHTAAADLPVGAVRDGEVIDVESVSRVLKDLWSANKGLSQQVRIGVANSKIVVRVLDVPPVTDGDELEAAVRFVAAEQLPMPLESAVLDFQSLGMVETPEGVRHRILLVAARREMIDSILQTVKGAGLKPVGIDLAAFAMVRVLTAGQPESGLFVSVGGLTNLAIVDDGLCTFTRMAGSGLEGMAMELAERRTLTLGHARAWLTHVGLVESVETIDGDAEIISDARLVLQDGVRRMAAEIRASSEYHAGLGGTPVSKIVLTGPALAVAGFDGSLQEEIGLPVEARAVTAGKGLAADVNLGGATVAAGLAVEKVAA